MTDVDPFTIEIIRHKLFRVTDEALITLGKLSGTPVTAEGHDVLVALYHADGTLLVVGLGFLHHILAAEQAVKHIIANFAEDPGIFEDDVFMANDPYTVAMHTPDIFMISPIHFEGELTGWVVNYVHVTDIGGIEVGGFCPNAKECFQEGFSTQGLKIAERGKIRKDVFNTFLNMIRDPDMTALDLKSQMAANHVAKQRLHKLYQDYSVGVVDAVGAHLIEQSERGIRQRLRELPDGTWRVRHYLDMPEHTYKIELAVTKSDDSLLYDFTGTDPQAPYGINCQYWAAKGAALAPFLTLLAWDLPWNEGIVNSFDVIAPEGTVVHCKRPTPVSLATIGAVTSVNVMSTVALSKMVGASEKYKDRATGVWTGAVVVNMVGGMNRWGEYVGQLGGDCFSIGEGARSFSDGASTGGYIVNVGLKFSNVEFEEQNFPKLFLYRRVVPDSGGPGKYRGGASHEHAVIPHGGNGSFTAVLSPGKGKYALGGVGISGGYPSISTEYLAFRQSNAEELPDTFASSTGKTEDIRATSTEIQGNEIMYLRQDGGGGFGDPLQRDPDAVLDDVVKNLVTNESAREIYGVVIDTGTIDLEATERLRLQHRENRIDRELEIDVSARSDVVRTPFRISEYLQQADVDDETIIQCTWCGGKVCAVEENWKDRAVSRKSASSSAGAYRYNSDEFSLQEYFCPDCATVLDVEVVAGNDPPLYDDVVKWNT